MSLFAKNDANQNIKKVHPFFIQAPLVLLGLIAFFFILKVMESVLVPLMFATLIAILLNPVCNFFMNKWKLPKPVAIILAIFLSLIIVAGVLAFLSAQIIQFGDMLPELKSKAVMIFHDIQEWIAAKLNISFQKQSQIIKDAANNSKELVGGTVGSIFSFVSVLILLPLYTFLLLFYKPLILNFFYEVFRKDHSEHVGAVLMETKNAIQQYIIGLLIEMLIVAIMNSAGLLIIGVKYAILLGCIGAILNVIPYIGGLIAIALPVLMALVTSNGLQKPILIVVAYIIIQFIDNNILVPRIVSSKVSVNALVSIIIILLGGMLWGVAGMFLSIPFIAVVKIVFDHVNDLKPWGKLLGSDMPNDNVFWKRLKFKSDKKQAAAR